MSGEIKKNSPGCDCCGGVLDVYIVVSRYNNTTDGYLTHRKITRSLGGSEWTIDVDSFTSNTVCDDSGNLYVGRNSGSPNNYIASKYDSSGSLTWSVSTPSGLSTATSGATAVAVDLNGNLYVAHSSGGYYYLTKFNSSGTAQWTNSSATDSSLNLLSWIAIDSSGNVLCLCGAPYSGSSLHIVKYNSSGTKQWDTTATDYPWTGAAVDTDDNIIVATQPSGDDYLRKYDSSGSEVSSGSWPITFANVQGVAVGPSNDVYASASGTIKRFTSSGSLTTTLIDTKIKVAPSAYRTSLYVLDADNVYTLWSESIGGTDYYDVAWIKMDGTVNGRWNEEPTTANPVIGLCKAPGRYVPFSAT